MTTVCLLPDLCDQRASDALEPQSCMAHSSMLLMFPAGLGSETPKVTGDILNALQLLVCIYTYYNSTYQLVHLLLIALSLL